MEKNEQGIANTSTKGENETRRARRSSANTFRTWSAAEIKRARATGKAQTYSVGDGLLLVISPAGAKTWTARLIKGGQDTRRAIGDATVMPVKEAKRLAMEMQKAFRGSEKKTLGVVVAEWQDTQAVAQSTSAARDRFIRYIPDRIKNKAVELLTRRELVDAMVETARAHGGLTARRVAAVIDRALMFALDSGYIQTTPAQGLARSQRLPRPAPAQHHYTTLNEKEMGRTLDRLTRVKPVSLRRALQLLIYLVPRVSELTEAEWTEIDWARAVWIKPATHTKMRREHVVPLPRQALELFREQYEYTGGVRFIFPNTHSQDRAISRGRLSQLIRECGVEGQTLHGLRAFAKTKLTEMGYADALTELMLGHRIEQTETRAAYNRSEFWEQRVQMAQAYADYIDGLREAAANPCPDGA